MNQSNEERFKQAYRTAVEREVEREAECLLEDQWFDVPSGMTVEVYAQKIADKMWRCFSRGERVVMNRNVLIRVCKTLGIGISQTALCLFAKGSIGSMKE